MLMIFPQSLSGLPGDNSHWTMKFIILVFTVLASLAVADIIKDKNVPPASGGALSVNSFTSWITRRIGKVQNSKSYLRRPMKKRVNGKGLRISKKRPASLPKRNRFKPNYSKPKYSKPKYSKAQHQKRPIKSKLSSNLKHQLSKHPIASRTPSKVKIQEKQFLVARPIGPAFPFGLTPSALLIPAIPTLVG
jgi:hypothetical protein